MTFARRRQPVVLMAGLLRWNQDLDAGGIVVGDEVEITARVRIARRAVQ